jgi:1,2-phenylacetyl-CoA epoxidase catalytic subunit
MSSTRIYTLPVEQTQWSTNGQNVTVFNWEYDEGREKMLNLYEKGKNRQWNTNTRLDWSQEVDLENPMGYPDEYNPLFGTPIWNRLSKKDIIELRLHLAARNFSQFMHGEQGALICTAKIVQTVPDVDAKFYAATQVIDEARHVETYARYLHEKLHLAYPISPSLLALLDNVIQDSRWDFTYLGMQILIEGLALAAFNGIRDNAREPLAAALNAYVMQDEARHVAFGRLTLRDYYPQLTQAERDEREEFVVEACYLMRDRLGADEVYRNLGYDLNEVYNYMRTGPYDFRAALFSRIVPTLKDIGLWGPRVQQAFTDMGVIAFQNLDPDELIQNDERVADKFDEISRAKKMTQDVIALGANE